MPPATVVAAPRTTAVDPYAVKPLTSKSRGLLRSHSTASSASSNGSMGLRREGSRSSSTASARSTTSARSTGSTRSLSRDEVRQRMSRPPDVPTAKGGAVNMRSATPEFIQTFWAGMKKDCDDFESRRRSKMKGEAAARANEAPVDEMPAAVRRPVIKASVSRRPASQDRAPAPVVAAAPAEPPDQNAKRASSRKMPIGTAPSTTNVKKAPPTRSTSQTKSLMPKPSAAAAKKPVTPTARPVVAAKPAISAKAATTAKPAAGVRAGPRVTSAKVASNPRSRPQTQPLSRRSGAQNTIGAAPSNPSKP